MLTFTESPFFIKLSREFIILLYSVDTDTCTVLPRFGLVLGCLVLSIVSSGQPENDKMAADLFIFDSVILTQYFIEFLLRIWSVGCRAKYSGTRKVIPNCYES